MNWRGALLTGLALFQASYTLKLDVPLVSIDVIVDSNNGVVKNPEKADFLVYENGMPQDIQFFSPVSAPYNVFL